MPDVSGRFRGSGWSRAREDGWERAFVRKHDLRAFKELMALVSDETYERMDEAERRFARRSVGWPDK